jgi:hypothetical protein
VRTGAVSFALVLAVVVGAGGCANALGIEEQTFDGGSDGGGADEPGSQSRPDARSATDAHPESSVSGDVCVIGGKMHANGAVNGSNDCQSCQPAVAPSGWSARADGTTCGTAGICRTGACVSGCEILNVYYAADAPDPNDPCQTCQPAVRTAGWSGVPDGTDCGNGQVCGGGKCGTQCVIAGTTYTSGETNPADPCQICQPGTFTSTWTTEADGTSCPGATCVSGACSGCSVGDTRCADDGDLETCESSGQWSMPVACPGTAPVCVQNQCTAPNCTGGSMMTWTEAQPAWDFDTPTAGTYSCAGSLPSGSFSSGQTVTVSATGSTVTGSAMFQCSAGTWVNAGATCDGAITSTLTPMECASSDPPSSMFIGIYQSVLFRCPDTSGLSTWLAAYNASSGCTGSTADVACWTAEIEMSGEYDPAQAAGHIAPGAESVLCGTSEGYPWSMSTTYLASNGMQCKYLP